MANKGIWSIVQYPKSTDLDKLLGILRGSGAAVMWILHDKDIKEDGKPKDPHYHIVAGWAKGFPEWGKLLDMIAEGAYTPPRIIDGQEQKPFKPKVSDCYPKGTPEEIRLYLLHWDDASKAKGKHQYAESELHTDERWNPSDYTKAEDKRRSKSAEKAAEKADAFAAALKVAKENDIGEWADLCDFYTDHALDLGALVTVAYPVKSYLDSRRNLGKTSAAHVKALLAQVNDLQDELKQYQSGKDPVYNELTARLKAKNHDLLRLQEECERHDKAAHRAISLLCDWYGKATGEYLSYTDAQQCVYIPEKTGLQNLIARIAQEKENLP